MTENTNNEQFCWTYPHWLIISGVIGAIISAGIFDVLSNDIMGILGAFFAITVTFIIYIGGIYLYKHTVNVRRNEYRS